MCAAVGQHAIQGGQRLTVEPLIRTKRRLGLKHFDPCTILLNNDLSAGAPGILEDLHQQYLLPPLHAGWTVRRKSTHFRSYEEVAKRFGKVLGIDPWLINPLFGKCSEVDYATQQGLDAVQAQVEVVLSKVRRKYKEYGIKEKPFVVVKPDNGTYGMGVMTVRDPKDLETLNRKTRNKMAVVKDGQQVHDVIVQEGVLTKHAYAPIGCTTRRQRTQPLLHVRGGGPARYAGCQLRARSNQPRCRNLRLSAAWQACNKLQSKQNVARFACSLRRSPAQNDRPDPLRWRGA